MKISSLYEIILSYKRIYDKINFKLKFLIINIFIIKYRF